MHGWKNAFDAGEWGLGRMTQSLTLGCDCLGEIHYFDATLANEQGKPWVIQNAICMHEEDYGMLWKHVDLLGGRREVRRSRRLVVSFIATVGNYEYGFFWYFYLDGNIQLEVKLTGIVSPMAIEPGTQPGVRQRRSAIGVAAPHHQHMFNARLDFDVDGAGQRGLRGRRRAAAARSRQPVAERVPAAPTRLDTELAAQRDIDAARSRTWRIVNPQVAQRPRPTGRLQARADDGDAHVARASGLADRQARRLRAAQPLGHALRARRAARRGRVPQPTRRRRRAAGWTAQDRNVADTDVVVWYSFGVTHFVRPEDWPVMPVEYTGFMLMPFGFFDRNPALDVAADRRHCHTTTETVMGTWTS